jgi:hypothetical protein
MSWPSEYMEFAKDILGKSLLNLRHHTPNTSRTSYRLANLLVSFLLLRILYSGFPYGIIQKLHADNTFDFLVSHFSLFKGHAFLHSAYTLRLMNLLRL